MKRLRIPDGESCFSVSCPTCGSPRRERCRFVLASGPADEMMGFHLARHDRLQEILRRRKKK